MGGGPSPVTGPSVGGRRRGRSGGIEGQPVGAGPRIKMLKDRQVKE